MKQTAQIAIKAMAIALLLCPIVVPVAADTNFSFAMPTPPNNVYAAYKKVGDKYYYTGQNGRVYWTRHPLENYYRTNHFHSHLKPGTYFSPDEVYDPDEINPNKTHGSFMMCEDGSCHKKFIYHASGTLGRLPVGLDKVYHLAALGGVMHPPSGSALERFSQSAWQSATRSRAIAGICGGGTRSGNKSKCMCAAGVEDALNNSGLCHGVSGDAINLRNNINSQSCPGLHAIAEKDPMSAPFGSVIVYDTTRRYGGVDYGHTEVVIPASAQAARTLGVPEGTKIYCSDFCNTAPFLGVVKGKATNWVAKMFSI